MLYIIFWILYTAKCLGEQQRPEIKYTRYPYNEREFFYIFFAVLFLCTRQVYAKYNERQSKMHKRNWRMKEK